MIVIVNREDVVERVVNRLKEELQEFSLVRPYEGELDRYFKQRQIEQPEFIAMTSLQTPFALVISKNRDNWEARNKELRVRHNLSIYVGVANEHNFADENVPGVFSLLSRCVAALHEWNCGLDGCGPMTLLDDGEYITRTDLYTVYDQKWFQLEIAIARR